MLYESSEIGDVSAQKPAQIARVARPTYGAGCTMCWMRRHGLAPLGSSHRSATRWCSRSASVAVDDPLEGHGHVDQVDGTKPVASGQLASVYGTMRCQT